MDTSQDSTRNLPNRKHPAHEVLIIPGQPLIVYLTVYTRNRQTWLATLEVHETLRSVWTKATGWLVGRYVIMPDHIHLFAAPGELEIEFDNWVRYWKSQFSKEHRNRAHRWQTDHWDRRLRAEESYESKWEYVRNNPVHHGLVERAEDWPFQGQIHDLPW